MDVPGSLVSFGNTFFTEDIKKVFEIEVKKINNESRIHFIRFVMTRKQFVGHDLIPDDGWYQDEQGNRWFDQ